MRRGSAYLFVFAGLLLLLTLIFVYRQIAGGAKTPSFVPDEKAPGAIGPELRPQTPWLDRISQVRENMVLFPAEEIDLQWDLVPPEARKEAVYVLAFPELDRYRYFCLSQVLQEKNFPREISRIGDSYTVYVRHKREKVVRALLNELEEYDISGEIREIIQTKPYEE